MVASPDFENTGPRVLPAFDRAGPSVGCVPLGLNPKRFAGLQSPTFEISDIKIPARDQDMVLDLEDLEFAGLRAKLKNLTDRSLEFAPVGMTQRTRTLHVPMTVKSA